MLRCLCGSVDEAFDFDFGSGHENSVMRLKSTLDSALNMEIV